MSQDFALEIESLIARLQPIRLEVLLAEQHFRKELDHVYSGNRQSARNLVHYVALRRHDIRELQEDLGRSALSSLGRLESHVMATLDALLALLYKIAGRNWHGRAIEETFAEFDSGSALLQKHAVEALGEALANRNVRIMVTMPSQAADDPILVRDFLNRGMNIMRVNCAHDSAAEWLRMVENLRAAEKETGKTCKIAFDLAGPKLRTGPVSPSPGIIRWKPVRNDLGQVTSSAYITFCSENYSSGDEAIAIPVKGSIFRYAQAGYTAVRSVIWATQVLESLVKRGLPSRAEVTDAAMSGRAECVMLNKGPHILLALDFLCDVLCRMEGHQTKKSALMRKLGVAEMAWK